MMTKTVICIVELKMKKRLKTYEIVRVQEDYIKIKNHHISFEMLDRSQLCVVEM